MTEILKDYENRGLLYSQNHPDLPLTIWNYTDKVQWENLWDEVTLTTRGLVTDNRGTVVARPFKKFFNLSENKTILTDDYVIYDKLDGSLGILFYYIDSWIFCSRGSFTSEQALKGKELLDKVCDYELLDKENTYCFEVIYKANKIVVDYDDFEGVVLTAVFNTNSGEEVDLDYYELPSVMEISSDTPLYKLNETIGENEEGYVIRFSNGERCKIKGSEYLRLHKLMSEMSTTAVWECLKNGSEITSILKDVPDEWFHAVKAYEDYMLTLFFYWQSYLKLEYLKYKDIADKKEFALTIMQHPQKSFLFSLRNGKDITEQIWKFIKPEYKRL